MKVAIYTQVRENYGTASEPHWKLKGGNVFVVPNLTSLQVLEVTNYSIQTLKSLIETLSTGFEEYVVDWAVLDNDVKVADEWESPFELRFIGDRWVATRTVENGEYGYMNSTVERKTEEYDMLPGGERDNYRSVYTMLNGDVVNGKDVQAYLTEAA